MERRTAFIYSRVSKLIQATEGKGIARQNDKGYNFVNDLNTSNIREGLPTYQIAEDLIIDKGLSAFYGHNTATNAGLGAFIEAAKNGQIEPHSLLVVENVDRLSRLHPDDTREIFKQLKNYKIDVAVVRFGIVIKHDEKSDLASDLVLTVAMHLAHLESEQKSQRIRATFDKKRAQEARGGTKRTSVCPAWMKLSSCKTKFELIPEAVETLKLIFELRIDGKGSHAICNFLNEQGIPRIARPKKGSPSKPWSKRMVEKYLKMEQAYGAFMPTTHLVGEDGSRIRQPMYDKPLEGYYPAVVSYETFIQAQQAFKSGKNTKGRTASKGANLFAWLCKCPSCGGSMVYYKPNRGAKRVRCRNQLDKNHCDQKSLNYEEMEKLLINKLSGLDYSKLQGESFKTLQKEIDLLQANISEEEEALTTLNNQLTTASASAISRLVQVVEQREEKLQTLKQQREAKLKVKFNYSEQNLANLKLEDTKDRERYNKFLRQYIEYILCGDKGTNVVRVKLKSVDKILSFYFNGFSSYSGADRPEDIVESIFTQGKSSKEINWGFSKLPDIDSECYKILEPPNNLKDPLVKLQYLHEVKRELYLRK